MAEDVVPIFNADLKDLVARGAKYIQIEDLGAGDWTSIRAPKWMIDVLNAWIDGVDAKIAWHCCLAPATATRFARSRTHCRGCWSGGKAVNVAQFALDFTLRDMATCSALEQLVPKTARSRSGVIDVRSLYIETDDEIVERRTTRCWSTSNTERVYLSTDCGLKRCPGSGAREAEGAVPRLTASGPSCQRRG